MTRGKETGAKETGEKEMGVKAMGAKEERKIARRQEGKVTC